MLEDSERGLYGVDGKSSSSNKRWRYICHGKRIHRFGRGKYHLSPELPISLLSCASLQKTNTPGLGQTHLTWCFSSLSPCGGAQKSCTTFEGRFILLVYKISSFHILLRRVSDGKSLCKPGRCPWFLQLQ